MLNSLHIANYPVNTLFLDQINCITSCTERQRIFFAALAPRVWKLKMVFFKSYAKALS